MLDIDKLEALAEAATPGPWENAEDAVFRVIVEAGNRWVCDCISGKVHSPQEAKDAAFIAAANPAAILELIAAYRSLKKRCKKFHKERGILATLLFGYGKEYHFCPPDLADYQTNCPGRASAMNECQRCWINFAQRARDCIQS